jgi:hypothetical protein
MGLLHELTLFYSTHYPLLTEGQKEEEEGAMISFGRRMSDTIPRIKKNLRYKERNLLSQPREVAEPVSRFLAGTFSAYPYSALSCFGKG